MKHFHDRLAPPKKTRVKIIRQNFSGFALGLAAFVLGIILVASFAIRIGQVQSEVDTLVRADRDQALWTATQIQVKLLEFEKLTKTAKTSPTSFENDVRAEFDIVYSRLGQVLEPNVADVFRAEGKFAIPVEIINLRDQMAAIVDLHEKLGERELDKLSSLSLQAHELWKGSLGLILQDGREYKVSVRQRAVSALQSVQSQLWLSLIIATSIPIVFIAMLFVRAKYAEARQHTLVDTLTGCASRAGLQHALSNQFSNASKSFSVAVVDINNLKMVNDAFGHEAGDLVIQSVGTALNKVTRGIDCAARIGGDEFFVLLDASVEQAELILQRAKEHLHQMSDTEKYGFIPMQFSFGVAHCATVEDFQVAINLADQRMYRRKEESKKLQTPPPVQASTRS